MAISCRAPRIRGYTSIEWGIIVKKPNKLTAYLDKATYFIEVMVSSLLLVAIVILLLEMICEQIGVPFKVLTDDFESILSKAFTLVIGVEFIKMLCKHSAETVIEVLLFAIARQMILSICCLA